jgi:hypothetical protein
VLPSETSNTWQVKANWIDEASEFIAIQQVVALWEDMSMQVTFWFNTPGNFTSWETMEQAKCIVLDNT